MSDDVSKDKNVYGLLSVTFLGIGVRDHSDKGLEIKMKCNNSTRSGIASRRVLLVLFYLLSNGLHVFLVLYIQHVNFTDILKILLYILAVY